MCLVIQEVLLLVSIVTLSVKFGLKSSVLYDLKIYANFSLFERIVWLVFRDNGDFNYCICANRNSVSIDFWRLILYVESDCIFNKLVIFFRFKMVCQIDCNKMEFVPLFAFTFYNLL